MKNTKKILGIVLVVMLLALAMSISAFAATTVTTENELNAALVNGVGYATLGEAITALNDGETLVILKGFTAGANEFIELNGKKNITITAVDGVVINGNISIGYHPSHINYGSDVDGTFTVKNLTVNGTMIVYSNNANLVVEDNNVAQLTVKIGKANANVVISGNTADSSIGTATEGYGMFIIPNATAYDLTVNNNTFKNISGHAFTIQGGGDGNVATAANSIAFANNTFDSWGLGGKSNRAAIKIWNDSKYAPADGGAVTEAMKELVWAVTDEAAGNKFNSTASNTVEFDAYGVAGDGDVIAPSVTYVATVNGAGYESFADALAAASAMTGDVVVEILDKVTLNTGLAGSYDSIKFVGKTATAEIYLDVQGYITATGKKVAFENLKLSKVEGGYIANAGFMNVAFGIYDVTEVTYTNCVFANGAYASSGNVKYTGCTFKRSHDKYGLWAYGDVNVTVDDCTFDDYRGIKMYAEDKAKTTDLTVKNTDFSAVTNKPAIVLTYGESVTLEGNTYSSTGVFELDLDGKPNGVTVTSDVNPTCVNDNGACGVLVDGKIYTTVAQAAAVAVEGSSVILLHNSTETVELPAGVELDKNGFDAAGITVKKKGLSGTGTEADPYRIENLEDLIWFRDNVDKCANDGSTQYAGKYVLLTADIDLAGINWNPIGTMSGDHGSFKGVFDGGNHTISNLNVQQAGNGIGLFARTTGNAVIKNLKLDNVTVKSTNNSSYVGGLVGNAYASTYIENVHVTGTIDISGRGYIGGIAGHGYVVMDNVSVDGTGTIYSTFWCAGGILGYAGEGLTNIMNAHVEGITITSAAGGLGAIVGMAEDNNGTQPISGSNLSAKDVEIKTYTGAYGDAYANYALGYLYGGNPSNLTGNLNVENVEVTTSSGEAPVYADAVATVNGKVYFTIKSAFAALKDGDTLTILAGVYSEGTIKFPASLNNVTIKGEDGAILKDMTLMASDGSNIAYTGITFDNITFENSNILFSGQRASAVFKDWTIKNCTFKNVARGNAAIGLNLNANEAMENFTFTGNTINGVTGGNYSGLVLRASKGTVVITDNNVQGAVWNAIQLINSTAGTLTIENNTFASGADEGVLNLYGVTATKLSIKNNKFLVTNGQPGICYLPAGDVSENYWGGNAPANLPEGVTCESYYADAELTELVVIAKPVAQIGDVKYTSLYDAMVAAKAGETVKLLCDVDLTGTEWEPVSFKGNFDGQNFKISNLTINKPGVSNVGFIVSLNGSFKNVTFVNPTVTGGENTGVVAGRAGGSAALADNITVTGTIKVETTHSGYARAGVIVGGWAYGNYTNITVDGLDKAISYIKHTGGGDGRYVAGIVGHADDVESFINCTVKNITISGGWLCGGITGPGPADGLVSGCAVEDINVNADYSGGMFGWYYGSGTIENSSVSDVTFTAGSTKNGAIGGYSNNTNATVNNVTISNVVNSNNMPLLEHVASVNGVYYTTLAEALAAVKGSTGNTITLLADASISGQNALDALTGDTLDLNDKTLTVSGNSYFSDGTTTFTNGNIVVSGYASDSFFCGYTAGAVIVFDDVVITGDNYKTGCALFNANQGKVEIKNSEITLSGDTEGGIVYGGSAVIDNTTIDATNVCRGITNSVATVQNNSVFAFDVGETCLNNSTVTINNSTVTIENATKRAVRLGNNTLALENGATLTATNCAADIVKLNDSSNAVVTVDTTSTLNAVDNVTVYVAVIGDKKFTSLQEAVNYAAANGGTVELIDNVELTEEITIPAGATVTLDLNGNDITAPINVIINNGTLTINDTVGNGNVYTTDVSAQGRATIVNYGTITINGGWYGDSNNDTTDRNAINRGNAIKNSGTAIINGGYFTNVSNQFISTEAYAYAINTLSGGTTTINNATVYGDINGLIFSDGNTVVNDGSFTLGRPNEENNLWYLAYGNVEIKGGTWVRAFKVPSWNTGYTTMTSNVVVTGGLFAQEPEILPEGYAAIKNLDGNYVVGVAPTATVNPMGPTLIPAGEYGVWDGKNYTSKGDVDLPLSFVMQFLADQTASDVANSPYADWYADFVITFDGIKNGSFVADGCYLAGYYGDFGWVKVPVDGMTIENDARYPVMLGVGLGQKYDYICTGVQDFKCALYITPEILEANPNLTVNLELAVVDNSKGESAAADALVKKESVYNVVDYDYEAEDFIVNYVAQIGDKKFTSLADAIAAIGSGDVVIELLADATLDYNAREAYGLAETTSVKINGNGHTLTLNQKNSDWASIGLANAGAKLVLNNMTIEKTGYGDTSGAWNTHAIIFKCNVEMNNVTVNNSVAVQNGATLNNVTINEANGYYGLWINANGQSVTMNGGEINATNGGRGIKIADQYVDSVASVTLNITDTKFNTAKKAAVLVTSPSGAKVTANGVDITNVKADNTNLVWVDEDYGAYYNSTKVYGEATKGQENVENFPIKVWYVNGEGVATSVRAYFKNLDDLFAAAATQVPGSNRIELKGNVVAKNKVNVSYGSNRVYSFVTDVAKGVTMTFEYADNWNMLPKFDLGENITLNVPYLQVIGGDITIAGTLNTNYLYLYGTGEGVTITETGVVNANTGDATVQVKGGTVLTVNGKLNTSTLNVWTQDVNNSELIVSGENAVVNAAHLHAWNGKDGVSSQKVVVEDGATLTATLFQADRGSVITVTDATVNSDAITLGYGNNIGTLVESGDSTINAPINIGSTVSTITSDGGLNVTTSIADHKVVFENNEYKVVPCEYVAEVNGVKYESLAEAIANANGGVVTLLADVELTEAVVISTNVTIDLATFEVSLNSTTVNCVFNIENGTVTIKNGTISTNNGQAIYAGLDKDISKAPVVKLENVTLKGADFGLSVFGGASVTIGNGVAINGSVEALRVWNSATVTVNAGATITCTGSGNDARAIAVYEAASVSVVGGTFTGVVDAIAYNDKTPKLVITGGTFTVDVNEYCADGYICVANGNGTYTIKKLFKVSGTNVYLDTDLSIDFIYNSADFNGTDYYAVIKKCHAENCVCDATTYYLSWNDFTVDTNGYVHVKASGIAAKEMVCDVEVVIYKGTYEIAEDGTVTENGYAVSQKAVDSIAKYAERGYNYYKVGGDGEALMNDAQREAYFRTLANMLVYGAEAQKIFHHYETVEGGLATTINDTVKTIVANYATANDVVPELEYSVTRDEAEGTTYFVGANIDLENTIFFNLYFINIDFEKEFDAKIVFTHHNGDKHEFSISAGTLNYSENNGFLQVNIDDLAPADLRLDVECIITVEGEQVSRVVLSVEDYLAHVRANDSANASMYNAVINYADAAKKYFYGN